MTEPDYEYHGLLASTWDLWRDDTSNWSDRHFFKRIIDRFGQPVLDIGCGTGRLVLDFCSLGIDIDGIDNSPEMLAVCRDKARRMKLSANLYQLDLSSAPLPRQYRTILGPSSVIQLLCERDDAHRAMLRCYDHLAPGGAFVTPFSFGWRAGDAVDTGWKLLFEKVRPGDGAIVRSWTHEWHEPDKQLWHAEQRFEVELNGQLTAREFHRRSPQGRWYTQPQAEELFRDAGFREVRLFHEFTDEPARSDDRLFTVLGVK